MVKRKPQKEVMCKTDILLIWSLNSSCLNWEPDCLILPVFASFCSLDLWKTEASNLPPNLEASIPLKNLPDIIIFHFYSLSAVISQNYSNSE